MTQQTPEETHVRRLWQRASGGSTDDAGFTLVEVIVSLVILGMVATAGLYFFVDGTRAVSHQQRSQSAVVVANQAMELAHAVQPRKSATLGTFGVVTGRDQAAVQSAWSAAATSGTEGLGDTYPTWDPGALAIGGEYASTTLVDDAVPLHSTTTLEGVKYTADTLIGICFRQLSTAAGASAPCTKLAGQATAPAAAPAGYAMLMRVMVNVTWGATSDGTCGANGRCSYQLSALIDPSEDLQWNNITQPIAVDDNAIVKAGGAPVVISVLDNDIIGPVVVNPVQKLTVKTGTGTIAAVGKGQVRFTPPANASGFMTFTYSLKDAQGIESNVATVRVTVEPLAFADSASTSKNTPVQIGVTDNDKGSPQSVTITTPPPAASGTVSVSGAVVTFVPTSKTGPTTFQYSYTDTSGLVSDIATVTVNVTNYAAPKVADITVVIPATQPPVITDLDMRNRTTNPAGYLYEIMSVTSVGTGQLKVNGNNYNSGTNKVGATLGYQPQANTVGVFQFTYRTTTPDGSGKSEIKTVTMVVMPVPKADTISVKKGSKDYPLPVGSNDVPNNFGGSSTFQVASISNPSCGSFTAQQRDVANGILRYNAPNGTGTCTFQYRITGTGAYTSLVSDPVPVTITVTP
jgi:prepilin-type N-terminal cleavage/methylation domain-containing protein